MASYSKGTGSTVVVYLIDHCLIKGDERKQITALCCGNANGDMMRPLTLFDGKRVLTDWVAETKDKIVVTSNTSGIMDTEIFARYIAQEILPFVEKLQLSISDEKVGVAACCIEIPYQ